MSRSIFLLGLLMTVISKCGGNNTAQDMQRMDEDFKDVVKEVMRHCKTHKISECNKFEFLTLLDRVLPSNGLQVLPGVYLSWQEVPVNTLLGSSSRQNDNRLKLKEVNKLLANRLFKELSSWSLRVVVFGKDTLHRLRTVLDGFLESEQRGLRSGKGYYGAWKYFGSALMTLAFTAFAVLITKSLTISTVALLLSVMGLLNGQGGGGDHGYSEHPTPVYRTPVVYAMPSGQEVASTPDKPQETQEDPNNPYVYVNRKSWKSGRSEDYDHHIKNYYYW